MKQVYEKKGWDLLWERKGENIEEFNPIKLDGFDSGLGNLNKDLVNVIINKIKLELNLSNKDNLLEVGCGAGMLLIPLSKYVGSVSGVDLSCSLIRILRKHLKGANLFVSGADNLPFKKNSFNKVLVHSVFQYFYSLAYAKQSISEMLRVCELEGKILIMDIPDLSKKEANDAYRLKLDSRKTQNPNLKHQFYEKDFFKNICKEKNLKRKIQDQDIKGYINSKFRFNVLIEK